METSKAASSRDGNAPGFGQEDVSFLKDFADSITRSSKPQLRFDVDARELHWKKELLEKYTNSWANSIQLTTPRAALRSPNDLLNEIADKFLRGSQWREPKAVNDRRAAVHLGKLTMRDELRQRGIRDIKNIMKTNFEIKGKFSSHAFDFCIANGKMYSAVQGLSFQGTDPKVKQKDADATAWAVDDVKKRKPTLPIAVIVVPPRGTSKAYENARSTFLGLGASVLRRQERYQELGRPGRCASPHAVQYCDSRGEYLQPSEGTSSAFLGSRLSTASKPLEPPTAYPQCREFVSARG